MIERKEYIKNNFTDIKLHSQNAFLYPVRISIFNEIKVITPLLKGDVIDLGCGIMPYREYILETNSKIKQYIGIDFKTAIATEYSIIKPDYYWDGNNIPLQDNSVDCLLATELLEHHPHPQELLKEIYRVLKKDGVLFFTVPFLWPLHIVPHDEYRYTPFALERMLKNTQFKNINLKSLGSYDYALAQMIALWLNFRPLRGLLKKIFQFFALFLIKYLIKKDNLFDKYQFNDATMITGIRGIAYKN